MQGHGKGFFRTPFHPLKGGTVYGKINPSSSARQAVNTGMQAYYEPMPGETFDVAIIGAGITGTMLAKDLSAYRARILLLDKENDIADGATMANSAIVHAGYDPEDGTLKGLLNVQGARLYESLCRDLQCRYLETGAYIAACGEEEEKHLDILKARADRRQIPCEFVPMEKARSEEPALSDGVTKVLSFPTTAVIYPWQVAHACAQVAVQNGAKVCLNAEVTAIEHADGLYRLRTAKGDFTARCVVNAAGTHAEAVARMVTDEPGFRMTPRKGEYYVLDKDAAFVRHIIFPVPSQEKGKGVLAVPTVYGNTLIGPNSDFVDDMDDPGTSVDGLKYVRDNIGKTLKNVPLNRAIRVFAGVRPTSDRPDFILEEAKGLPGFINAASIESPGLASSPAISRYVIDRLILPRFAFEKNGNAVMTRTAPPVLNEMSVEERNALIAKNPAYGKIICRCETVSEGEIVDAIRAPLGARTVKGVKKRVRPGMGRCQGGFCEPRVVEILARELNVSPLDIVLDGPGSWILEKENR